MIRPLNIKPLLLLLLAIAVIILLPVTVLAQGGAKNVIILIGDGMGYAHVLAARVFAVGPKEFLSMETLPHHGYVTIYSADSLVTDSAASTTSMSTGFKVKNKMLSESPEGAEYETILERAKKQGKAAGLVTTTEVTHATPAAFGAHARLREEVEDIISDYLTQTQPDVLLGGGIRYWESTPERRINALKEAEKTEYTLVRTKDELLNLDLSKTKRVLGLFSPSHMNYTSPTYSSAIEPTLKEMTLKALELLDRNPHGFFLMVEGGRIDHAGHENNLKRVVYEIIEFDKTCQAVLAWAREKKEREENTLILITADHETGGLAILGHEGALPEKGEWVEVKWATKEHTALDVPVWATGPGSEAVHGRMDNTDIFRIMKEALGPIPEPAPIGP